METLILLNQQQMIGKYIPEYVLELARKQFLRLYHAKAGYFVHDAILHLACKLWFWPKHQKDFKTQAWESHNYQM